MPRPKKCRRIQSLPEVMCFKPVGVPLRELERVIIEHDEYEAFKLAAYDKLLQEEGAERMDISRPTFTRIYNCAVQKIAQAIVEGKIIDINCCEEVITRIKENERIGPGRHGRGMGRHHHRPDVAGEGKRMRYNLNKNE
jgi:predicted DNA-binding protein (UPF0251 family)